MRFSRGNQVDGSPLGRSLDTSGGRVIRKLCELVGAETIIRRAEDASARRVIRKLFELVGAETILPQSV